VGSLKLDELKQVRFSFADQHGVLRGKTLALSEAKAAMERGVTITSTLLLKDTSHKTVFPAFTPGGGVGMPELQGAADILMMPDESTFRVLPWARDTGWVLCDLALQDGKAVPYDVRSLLKKSIQKNENGKTPLMVLDEGKAVELKGPVTVDGIGPTNGMDEYWKESDARRRKQSKWAA